MQMIVGMRTPDEVAAEEGAITRAPTADEEKRSRVALVLSKFTKQSNHDVLLWLLENEMPELVTRAHAMRWFANDIVENALLLDAEPLREKMGLDDVTLAKALKSKFDLMATKAEAEVVAQEAGNKTEAENGWDFQKDWDSWYDYILTLMDNELMQVKLDALQAKEHKIGLSLLVLSALMTTWTVSVFAQRTPSMVENAITSILSLSITLLSGYAKFAKLTEDVTYYSALTKKLSDRRDHYEGYLCMPPKDRISFGEFKANNNSYATEELRTPQNEADLLVEKIEKISPKVYEIYAPLGLWKPYTHDHSQPTGEAYQFGNNPRSQDDYAVMQKILVSLGDGNYLGHFFQRPEDDLIDHKFWNIDGSPMHA